HENVVNSESVIRDADMAEEMTKFTRNQIMIESSTAMLAQANQTPKSILKLLG
ncbi:MAG: flagellin, partial [SAR324 cluster bacterium]|nr:flagellin [SAR324 cluster bacterium]